MVREDCAYSIGGGLVSYINDDIEYESRVDYVLQLKQFGWN